MSSSRLLSFGLASLVLTSAATATALTLPLQGRLTTVSGGPVSDGYYAAKFRIYATKDATDALWTEAWLGLDVKSGMFVAELGTQDAKQPVPDDLITTHDELWIGVQVSVEPELPRARFGSVPYAVRAQWADGLIGGLQGGKILDGTVPVKALAFAYAGSTEKGGAAMDLACTGCVGLDELASGVLDAKNVAFGTGTVEASLTGLGTTIDGVGAKVDTLASGVTVEGGKVGLGAAPAPGCGVDVTSKQGPFCVDGAPALIVRIAASEAEMQALAKPGQIVMRSDTGKVYIYANDTWRQMQFVANCGDKIVDPPETCDDGNTNDTDSCIACQLAKCGDTKVYAGVEECDDGNSVDTDACVACKNATCGDGKIQAGVELCDGTSIPAGVTCASLKPGSNGTVGCAADCKAYDTSKCAVLGDPGNPAASCLAIKQANAGAPTGVYTLTLGTGTVKVWCEMSADGGGWTLVSAWPYATVPKPWGSFTQAPAGGVDPSPNVQHMVAFLTLFPAPTALRMSYKGNGQSFTDTFKSGANWEKGGADGLRRQVANGYFLIFDDTVQTCVNPGSPGLGVCVQNAANPFHCDGNGGGINGKGLYNDCTYDESNCSGWSWKIGTGGTVDVCKPTDLVHVWLK